MPIAATNDPMTELVSAEPGRVVYRDLQSGEVWAELGTCNRCGKCMEPDGLDYETRPHYVTRPSILRVIPDCSLTFEVL
jgi:hypothetical protein